MEIINAKESINNILFNLFDQLIQYETDSKKKYDIFNKKLENHLILNNELIEQNKKLERIINLEKTKHIDYENIINELNDKLNHKLNNEERFNMLKVQDKEIDNLNKVNSNLSNKVTKLEEEIFLLKSSNNSIVLEEEVSSLHKSNNELNDNIQQETPVDDNIQQETPNNHSNDENFKVKIIKHKKVKYYIIIDESPSYIYKINNSGQIGDVVGEIKNGKKIIYKN